MNTFKSLRINRQDLVETPFRSEYHMEGFLIDNEELLAVPDYFDFNGILGNQVPLTSKLRIDLLAEYSDRLAIVELKKEKLCPRDLKQLYQYLEEREKCLDYLIKHEKYDKDILEEKGKNWLGVLIGAEVPFDLLEELKKSNYQHNGIPVVVVALRRFANESTGEVYIVTDTYFEAGKDYTKYTLKYGGQLIASNVGKSKLVWEVINDYVHRNPSYTLQKLKSVFPDNLLPGSLEVVTSLNYAQSVVDKTGYIRYRMKDKEILHTNNGEEAVVVSTQWGVGTIGDFIEVAKGLGYTI